MIYISPWETIIGEKSLSHSQYLIRVTSQGTQVIMSCATWLKGEANPIKVFVGIIVKWPANNKTIIFWRQEVLIIIIKSYTIILVDVVLLPSCS